MDAACLDFGDTQGFQRLDNLQNGTAGGDFVVEDKRSFAFDFADDMVDGWLFGIVVTPFIKNCQGQAQAYRIMPRPLGAARIGSNDNAIVNSRFLIIFAEDGRPEDGRRGS